MNFANYLEKLKKQKIADDNYIKSKTKNELEEANNETDRIKKQYVSLQKLKLGQYASDEFDLKESLRKNEISQEEYEIRVGKIRLSQASDTAQQIAGIATSLNNFTSSLREQELQDAEGNEQKQKEIRKKYATIQMAMTITEIIANTAAGMAATVKNVGMPIAIPFLIAQGIQGAANLVAANTQYNAIQKLAKGGFVEGPGTATSDSIPTFLSNGEFVVNSATAQQNKALLTAINNNQTIIDYDLLAMKLGKVINDKQVYLNTNNLNNHNALQTKIIQKSSTK